MSDMRPTTDWEPRRTISAFAGRYLLQFARKLPQANKKQIESLVLKASVLKGRRLVPEKMLESKFVETLKYLIETDRLIGDYLEFGVYTGASMACMYRATQRTNLESMRFIGFDSFEGLKPDVVNEDGGVWEASRYSCPHSVTKWFLQREGVDMNRVELVKGWFQDSLNKGTAQRLGLQKASMIMVDCDNYSATKRALAFAEPYIRDQSIVFFDDWHSHNLAEQGMGEKRAFVEFLATHPSLVAEPFGSYHENSEVYLLKRQN